ncbi:translation initiation factor eIF2 assembly protein-like [Liolophura sinensis]|uniref:translation initiation factor eIF2 assembly protein-like n=1 Tax=Liolophura sinensis TaxID=3198878 RepID=UPI003158D67B
MKKEDVLKCSFSSWYPTFEDVTIKSRVLPLSSEFVEYLLADGIVLPESETSDQPSARQTNDDQKCTVSTEETDWNDDVGAHAPCFPQLEGKLTQSLSELGGKVFPKLNWSAPKDATWMSFDRTLKCVCPSDIYLLLKSSDFITHDLTEPFMESEDYIEGEKVDVKYELVLRKWCDLDPGMEFRCFVHNHKLVAVSQRDCLQYFDFLPNMKTEIVSGIKSFFFHVIDGNFPSDNYVFDVYKRANGTFWVLDFNPFGNVTDSLMFKWDEIKRLSDQELELPKFRCLESQIGISGSAYTSNAVPRELADISSGDEFNKLLSMMQSIPGNQYDSDTESN